MRRIISTLLCWVAAISCVLGDDARSPVLAVYLPHYRNAEGIEKRLFGATNLVLFSASPRKDGSVDFSKIDAKLLDAAKTVQDKGGVEVTLCVGGWGKSESFSSAVKTEELRARFIKDLVGFCLTHKLPGVDLDWEFPKGEEQTANYVQFIEALSVRLHEKNLSLSLASDSNHLLPRQCYRHVDSVNLMHYQPWAKREYETWLVESLERTIKHGVPAAKIVLGIPFFTKEQGGERRAVSYGDIIRKGDAAYPKSEHGFWPVGQETCDLRLKLVKTHNLRGVMVWDYGHDSPDPKRSLLRYLSKGVRGLPPRQ